MISFVVAASLLFTEPAPLEMPRASAYLVREHGVRRLEDRYSNADLWTTRAVSGRWVDDDGRVFTAADLRCLPPAFPAEQTRIDHVAGEKAADLRDDDDVLKMVEALSPVEVVRKFARPDQLPHGFKDVRYYQGTNVCAIVCAYLREKSPCWRYAAWELVEGDDFAERLECFEDELFWRGGERGLVGQPDTAEPKTSSRRASSPGERELLRADAAHSVAAYAGWHFTSSSEFVILDDLVFGREVIASLTNEIPVLRARYAATVPTPLDGSNVLAVARIFRNRDDYELAAGEEMRWTAAYWCPSRRELVACLPPDGDLAQLRRTFRHEAFHQYLSYATSMIPASPWFNEGYAQYFEDDEDLSFGLEVPSDRWDELELRLPALMMLDYRAFYDGSPDERRTKYRLAKSIAVFLELGAPDVRFEPFKDVKRDYIAALLESQDMRRATFAAFGSTEKMRRFANEWKRYWQNH